MPPADPWGLRPRYVYRLRTWNDAARCPDPRCLHQQCATRRIRWRRLYMRAVCNPAPCALLRLIMRRMAQWDMLPEMRR